MKIIICSSESQASQKAYEILKDVITTNPNATLGLATGSSPLGLYANMIEDHKQNGVSYKNIKTFNLDEYVGLESSHSQSYAYFMRNNLFDHIDIDLNNTNIPNGKASDLTAECNRYNNLLANSTIDLQILGIGSNGHIAFNEPGTPLDSVTSIVNLTESTIKDNSRLFDNIDEVPKMALSMGLKNIIKAEKIVLIATGENKANAIYEMVNGEVTCNLPASILQNHNDVTIIIDTNAGKLLK